MRVVIVDDSPIVRVRLKDLLRADAPHAEVVGEAEETQTAIRLIQDTLPDVVILDLKLAGGSGFEVLRAVKLVPHAPVVIVLTNLTSFEYQTTCLEAGAEFFFDKSFVFDQLAKTIQTLSRRLGKST
ncbi:MAG TPA: response regulator transcription factor [Nitrospiraceae bacterium]